jgi:hypothetical protein
MKKNALIAIGFFSALFYTVSATLPAMAKKYDLVVREKKIIVASATFNSATNTFLVDDNKKDGRRAVVKYRSSDGVIRKCRDKDGAASDPDPCPLRGIKGGQVFEWKLCVKDGDGDSGEPKKCKPESGWAKARAGR